MVFTSAEEHGKPPLSVVHPENPEKGHHMYDLSCQPIVVVVLVVVGGGIDEFPTRGMALSTISYGLRH